MLSPRSQFLGVLVLAATLGGCASVEQAQRDQEQHDLGLAQQSCAGSGLSSGTPEFSECVTQEQTTVAQERLAEQRTIMRQQRPGLSVAPPPLGRIQPNSGELCLPTASGLSLTC